MSPRPAGRRAGPGRPAARRRQRPVRPRRAAGGDSRRRGQRAAPVGALLAGGLPAPDCSPPQAWLRCTARVLRRMPPELAGYPPPQGLAELRQQIAAHLAATRGLLADPACIVVTGGTQQALRLAADLLLDPGDAVWVEDPGYIAGRGALIAAGAVPVAVPSDTEGLDVAAGVRLAPDARLALVAPSHSTPLGGRAADRPAAGAARLGGAGQRLGAGRRLRLRIPLGGPAAAAAGDARSHRAGDLLRHLQQDARPGDPAGFRRGAGAAGPGLRPRSHPDRSRQLDALSQAVLTEFMRQGLLAPHIRRMRTEYARRRAALLAALQRHAPPSRRSPAPGGLHMVARLPDGADEAAVGARLPRPRSGGGAAARLFRRTAAHGRPGHRLRQHAGGARRRSGAAARTRAPDDRMIRSYSVCSHLPPAGAWGMPSSPDCHRGTGAATAF